MARPDNLPIAPISADPANDVDPRPPGDPDPAGGQFFGGVNQAGGQAAIGACTAVKDVKAQDWRPTPIDPLKYPRIGWGGDSDEPGQEDADIVDALVPDYGGTDFNDTLAFVTADTQAAPGAVYDSGSGAVNRGPDTIEIGEDAWGTVPIP